MKTTLLFVFVISSLVHLVSSQTVFATRYCDCCKPSGSWPGKAHLGNLIKACRHGGQEVVPYDELGTPGTSGCDNGGLSLDQKQYTCSDMMRPWASEDGKIGYSFVAMSGDESQIEAGCFVVQLKPETYEQEPQGKIEHLVMQVVNTGGDLAANPVHVDVLVAGGGQGAFQGGCIHEYSNSTYDASKWNPSSDNEIAQVYGGILERSSCSLMPDNETREGCEFRFDNLGNNPIMQTNPIAIQCPSELINISGGWRLDDNQKPILIQAGKVADWQSLYKTTGKSYESVESKYLKIDSSSGAIVPATQQEAQEKSVQGGASNSGSHPVSSSHTDSASGKAKVNGSSNGSQVKANFSSNHSEYGKKNEPSSGPSTKSEYGNKNGQNPSSGSVPPTKQGTHHTSTEKRVGSEYSHNNQPQPQHRSHHHHHHHRHHEKQHSSESQEKNKKRCPPNKRDLPRRLESDATY